MRTLVLVGLVLGGGCTAPNPEAVEDGGGDAATDLSADLAPSSDMFDTDAAACGQLAAHCCTGGKCDPGLACVVTIAGSVGNCETAQPDMTPCGGQGEACCAGACMVGACIEGTCQICGAAGQPCCGTAKTCDPGLVCAGISCT